MAKDVRNVLAELVSAYAQQSPLPTGLRTGTIAGGLLSDKPFIPTEPFKPESLVDTTKNNEPSLINRIIDIVSRPLYAVMNPIEAQIEEQGMSIGDVFKEAWEGLSGKDKVLGSDVLKAANVKNDALRGVLGFGLDVALDPLTYVGVGLASKLGRAITQSERGLGELTSATERAAQDVTERISQLEPHRLTGPTEVPVPTPRRPVAAPGPAPTTSIRPGDVLINMPESRPRSGRQVLEELLKEESAAGATQRARMIRNTLRDLEEVTPETFKVGQAGKAKVAVPNIEIIKALGEMLQAEKSPPIRNMLQQQLRKFEAEVKPASEIAQTGKPVMPRNMPATSAPRRAQAVSIADEFLKKSSSGKFKEITPIGQGRLYDRISNWVEANVRANKTAKASTKLAMLRQAEDAILAAGKKLTDAKGNTARLSDAINFLSDRTKAQEVISAFREGKTLQEVENAIAVGAREVAEEVLDPAFSVAERIARDVQPLPPSRIDATRIEVNSELRKLIQDAGASSKEGKAAKDYLDRLFNVEIDASSNAIKQQAREILQGIAKEQLDATTIAKMNEGVFKFLGANPKVLGKEVGPGNRAVESIMTRVATWYGAKDLRPWARDYIDTMMVFPSAFQKAWNRVVRRTTQDQRREAWLMAQGRTPLVGQGTEVDLGIAFRHSMERMFASSDIADDAIAGNSVVTRAGVTMDELNKALKETRLDLQFTKGKGVDKFGREYDYSKGTDWLKSWEIWDIDDPISALYATQRSLLEITRTHAMWDDAAARWGLPTKTGEFAVETVVPRLKGFYFPKEIAEQINSTFKRMEIDKFKSGGPLVRLFDKTQRAWKSGVTVYAPAHHIRNVIGDVYLGAMDGVTSIRPYRKSLKVLHAMRNRYRDVMQVQNVMDPKYVRDAMTRPGDVILTTKAGHKLTAEQIYLQAENKGFLPKSHVLEELLTEEQLLPFQPFGGRMMRGAHFVSENRDHWVRLAHFIDVLEKSKIKNLDEAINVAARRVRKFHPDGLDLTGFEKNVLRRAIPFYSWLRKATPLVIETAVLRPHIAFAYPKAMGEIQRALGVPLGENAGFGNPYPMDALLPEWIRERGIGPVLDPAQGGLVGMLANLGRQAGRYGPEPGYTIVNPSNPLLDQLVELSDPTRSIYSGLTPMARIPAELLSGRTSLDIPLEEIPGGAVGHLLQQVPPVGTMARATGLTRPEEGYSPEGLVNWLTALGIRGTGPMNRQAVFELRERLRQEAGL